MDINYQIKIYNQLSPKILNKIKKFGKDNPGNTIRTDKEEKIHQDKYCSNQDIKKIILALEDNQIIGTIAVFRRSIVWGNQNISLGGIGKVRVAIDKRKKGVASAMMEEAMKRLHQLNCDIAILCTNINSFLADWYSQYGFTLMKKPYQYLGKSGEKYIEKEGMVAPIKSIKTFNQVQNSSKSLDIGKGNW